MEHKNSQSASYAAAGVDITAGYRAVELMKSHIARTKNEGCLDDVGGFGGCFGLPLAGMEEPVLVSGTDGCGTKVKLAQLMDKHDTIGIDAVAMCVNDIICCGARPLFFLDYIACGKNVPEKIAAIVSGVAEGCVQSGAALIGGETAEHPGMMPVEDYDLAGFAVGIVDKKKILDNKRMAEGDAVIALASTGIHSNGFSLCRKVFNIDANPADLYVARDELGGKSVAEALLVPTRIYVKSILALIDKVEVGDIREYRLGDPLKSIHWNLSSRSEDLIVKDYNSGSTKTTYIYCDLAARFPEEAPAVPTSSRSEEKRAIREAKERERLEAYRKKLISSAAERGDTLSEEQLREILQTKREKREARKARRAEKKRERQMLDLAILQKKHPEKAARRMDALRAAEQKKMPDAEAHSPSESTVSREKEAHLLREDRFYEDMNEYCADGVVELTIATALREVRNGNEVVLIWYDNRSESGICAYTFHSPEEFQTVYPVFATAPLSASDRFVGDLALLTGDPSGIRRIFVTASVDGETVGAFAGMPVSAGEFGGSEILLYHPETRFLYPEKRNAYVEGCRDAVARSGFRLTVETLEGKAVMGGDSDVGR